MVILLVCKPRSVVLRHDSPSDVVKPAVTLKRYMYVGMYTEGHTHLSRLYLPHVQSVGQKASSAASREAPPAIS